MILGNFAPAPVLSCSICLKVIDPAKDDYLVLEKWTAHIQCIGPELMFCSEQCLEDWRHLV